MRSRKILLIILFLIIGVILTGCGFKIEPKVEDLGLGGVGLGTTISDDQTEEAPQDNSQNSSATQSNTNKSIDDDDIQFGFETVDLVANGKSVRVQVDTFGSTTKQENGPYNLDYRLTINGKTLKEGIYHLCLNTIMLRKMQE